MIPSIEAIVEGLLDGSIDRSQAVGWLILHAEGAANDLRDMFAGQALNGILSDSGMRPENEAELHHLSQRCYQQADSMLAEREKANG